MSDDRHKDKEKDKDAVKITNQCRARGGMEYDLKADGARLALLILPRSTEDDPGEWRVEARASRAPEAVVVTEWGSTRTEALHAVGRSWVSKAPAHRLPPFDWEAIAVALIEVRAL
jgi:hypothetical protein